MTKPIHIDALIHPNKGRGKVTIIVKQGDKEIDRVGPFRGGSEAMMHALSAMGRKHRGKDQHRG